MLLAGREWDECQEAHGQDEVELVALLSSLHSVALVCRDRDLQLGECGKRTEMPSSNSGRDSRRSSKSGPSGNEAYKSSDRREKAKSSQVYPSSRRGSRQAESTLGSVPERPSVKGRTYSAPLVDRVGEPGRRDELHDGEQTRKESKSSSAPRVDAGGVGVEDAQDEDEVAGVVGAVKRFQPFQNPEVYWEA